jgi:heavy metal translocating P-type ATPase
MVGTGRGAESGILYRSGADVENLQRTQCVVLDKTSTITEGKPTVTDVLPAPSLSTAELMQLATGLERGSNHPLASAVVEYAKTRNASPKQASDFKNYVGKGVGCTVKEGFFQKKVEILAGSLEFMRERGITVPGDGFEDLICTKLYFAKNQKFIGVMCVADTVKESAKQTVASLKKQGITVVMLTGDSTDVAESVAKSVGIDKVYARVLPQDKERIVRELSGGKNTVAMVGDGINDSPALTAAHVGIAIGSGADIAIDCADIVLMKSDPADVDRAIRYSKQTVTNIKQNLFWAFFYNCVGIPIAAGVLYPIGILLSPMIGSFAMSLSSVFVVTNALRLYKKK